MRCWSAYKAAKIAITAVGTAHGRGAWPAQGRAGIDDVEMEGRQQLQEIEQDRWPRHEHALGERERTRQPRGPDVLVLEMDGEEAEGDRRHEIRGQPEIAAVP